MVEVLVADIVAVTLSMLRVQCITKGRYPDLHRIRSTEGTIFKPAEGAGVTQ